MSVGALELLESVRGVVVVGALIVSLAIVYLLPGTDRRLARVRSRLLHGMPWGTLLTILFVTSVYLFVQGGLAHPNRPLVVPFRSWSYFYPLGMLTAAFSHASQSHLLGNLVATAAYASVAEYAWGRYPRTRGTQTFTSRWTNPYVRILVVPAVSIAAGLFTALFALGPVVGFSGVVFAFAGFAFVQRPLLTTLAILGSRILNLTLSAVLNPRVSTSPRPRVVTPWWTDVAVQGHAIGLLAGVLLAVALAHSRDEWPDPRRVWFGLLAFAAYQGLWALYVPDGNGRYVLYRWAGVSLVFLFTAVVVVGATRSAEYELPVLGTSRRTVALALVVVTLASFSGAGVVYNVAPLDQQPGPEPAVHVRDYSVGYAEDVPDGYVGAISVPFVDYSPAINTSGVIVTSERRYVWRTMVRPAVLKNRGRTSVLLGGLGWRERVYVNRTGWTLAGKKAVYKVYLRPAGRNRTLAFSSEPATAAPIIAGHNISMEPTTDRFRFVVSRANRTVGTTPVPGNGSSAHVAGITFRRNRSTVYAIANRTRVAIAEQSDNPYRE